MTHQRTCALLAGVSAAIAGLLLAGCSEGSSDARPLPEGTAEAATSRTPEAESAEALGAYRAMWDDLAAAAATSDPKHPRLKAHASDEALALLRHMMTEDRKKGVVTKGELRLDPAVEDAEDSEATKVLVRDCADGSNWLHYTKGGDLYNDVPGGHHRVDATVRQHDGVWRVERLYIDEVGTC